MIKFKAKIAKANRDARRHLDLRDMVGAIAKMAADAGAEPHRVAEILFDEMVVACERCGMKQSEVRDFVCERLGKQWMLP